VLIPQFLQELLGYTAASAGMAISAGGLVLMAFFPVAGYVAPRFDQRMIVSCGFLITTLGLIRITQLNLNMGFQTALSWRAVIALGLPFLFVPINVLCYADIPQSRNNEVSGLTALSRNLGGSFGISFVTALLTRRTQAHETYLGAHQTAGSQAYETMSKGIADTYERGGMAYPDAVHHAAERIYDMMHTQARTLAYVDTAWILVGLTALLIPLPFLMKRPKSKRGKAPVAGHCERFTSPSPVAAKWPEHEEEVAPRGARSDIELRTGPKTSAYLTLIS
jgi:MFS transporter, DHA2 family, multidrug resistance protein